MEAPVTYLTYSCKVFEDGKTIDYQRTDFVKLASLDKTHRRGDAGKSEALLGAFTSVNTPDGNHAGAGP